MANNYGGNFTSFDEYLNQHKIRRDRESYPFYSDNADYNTNSKSYYDDLARKNKLIEILAKRIWQYDEELAKRFEEWDKNLEELPEDLENLLIKWMEDGTLEKIINDNIFNKLNNKIDKINTKLDKIFINIDEFKGSDCQKINQALGMAKVLGGGTVYVPKRVYNIDCELIIYENTTLYSEIGTRYNRISDGYMIMNGERGKNYDRYEGNGNIAIINGIWDGKGQNENVGNGSNIVIAHADNVLIDNVEILNANSHHIELNSSKNVVIQNSKILGQLSRLQYVEGIQLDLSTKHGFNAFGSHDATPCKNVIIQNNYFGGSDDLPSLSRGVGTHATRIGAYMDNIKIINNRFDDLRDFCTQLVSYRDSEFSGNKCYNCVGGIIMYATDRSNPNHTIDIYGNTTTEGQPLKNIKIENNTFEKINQKQVIYMLGYKDNRNEKITVSNNVIKDCVNASGIIINFFTDYTTIKGNKINRVNRFAILVKSSNYVMISNNIINDTMEYSAIRVMENVTVINVTNNMISRAGGNAINIFDNIKDIIISGNNIFGANGINEDYDAISMHSNGSNINISNNIFDTTSNHVYKSAVYVTGTVKNGLRIGNIAKKGNNDEVYRTLNIVDNGDIVVS